MMSRRKQRGREICGVIAVDKPAGMTSHDVVDRVRRVLRQRSVGHTGTLDPAATGLLMLCVGGATKFARYLSGMDKTYRAVVCFGRSTDSCDNDGETVAVYDGDLTQAVTEDKVKAALGKFSGEFSQMPPAFSAKKVKGQAAYKLARKGIEPELKSVAVRVDKITMSRCEPPDVEFELSCSAGFYIRALARDLGLELGTGAYLKSLVRTHVGPFALDQAVGLDILTAADQGRVEKEYLLGLNEALKFMPAVSLADQAVEELFFGRQVELESGVLGKGDGGAGGGLVTVRVLDSKGVFLGVGELDSFRGAADVLKPRRLMAGASPARKDAGRDDLESTE
jgi:tRNA pseudouridine55 synthase